MDALNVKHNHYVTLKNNGGTWYFKKTTETAADESPTTFIQLMLEVEPEV